MRILVVDDEPRLAGALKWGLESNSFTVDVCHDGRDAVRLALDHEYAAIVLDIMLPGLNGYRVCARLRGAGDSTPILMPGCGPWCAAAGRPRPC